MTDVWRKKDGGLGKLIIHFPSPLWMTSLVRSYWLVNDEFSLCSLAEWSLTLIFILCVFSFLVGVDIWQIGSLYVCLPESEAHKCITEAPVPENYYSFKVNGLQKMTPALWRWWGSAGLSVVANPTDLRMTSVHTVFDCINVSAQNGSRTLEG